MKSTKRALAWLPLLLPVFLAACGQVNPAYVLPDICKEYDNAQFTPLATAPPPTDVFEDPGQIKVMHGVGSAQLSSGKKIIKVEQSVTIPSYANQAAVFLNGWRLNYQGGDQNVLGLGALITKIKLDQRNQKLSWNAAGILRDDDFKEGYKFTYNYTVIAWASGALNLRVDQGNPDNFCNPDTDLPDKSFLAFNTGTTTALSVFSVFSQDPASTTYGPVAILPRGFAFVWYGGDHNLLQLGYNLDYSEISVVQGKIYNNNKNHVHIVGDVLSGIPAPLPNPASRVDSGFVSWNTHAIFKDNRYRRDHIFSEIVSTLSGSDLGLIQPPFSILPWDQGAIGPVSPAGVITKDVVIENLPYKYAIPVLTGWELGYIDDDQNLEEGGIWIDEWSYTPGSGSGIGGTLRYKISSILQDDDTTTYHYSRHRVTVVGIKSILAQPIP
jgi:hypothetical protein